MPYPYTLMPDGQTLEPEEEQEPEPSNEGTPAEPESGPKPPPGIDIPGYTPTPGYGPPPAPPISLPAPPPGIPVPAYTPPPATTLPPAILVPPELLDISEDAFGSLEQHIAAMNSGQPVESFTENIGQAPTPVTDVYGNMPLTPGQAMDVDYLLSFVTDTLAREVLISLKRDGIPPRSQRNDFMSPYAEWNWDETSDALALEMIDIVEQSEMDEQLAHADRPEPIIRQEEHYIILSVDGGLKVHEDVEGILRGDAASSVLPVIPDDFSILVLDQYPLHPYAVKIYVARNEFWIDLRDDAVELEFERIDEVPQLYKPLRAQVSGQEYDNTSLDFMSALTKALESQPIGVIHISGTLKIYRDQNLDELGSTIDHVDHEFGVYKFSKDNQHAVLIDYVGQKIWIDTSDAKTEFTSVAHGEHGYTSEQEEEGVVSTETKSEYHRQSIAPGEDAKTENVEISHRVYADRTDDQLGWLTRDYNTTSNTKFYVQSPVIGPDVRVELVIRAESHPKSGLGNYVVISFPASVYLSNPKIMNQLKMQDLAAQRLISRSRAPHLTHEERAQMERMAHLTKHNPERWQEDDRIIMAYAHLSHVEPHIVPGLRIDDAEKSLIGKTGNTGKDIEFHHLDVLQVLVGSIEPGSGALESWMAWLREKYVVEGSQDVEHFFQTAAASQLFPNRNSTLYSENLDTARTHPELDDTFRIAQYFFHEPDPKDSIYFEDE